MLLGLRHTVGVGTAFNWVTGLMQPDLPCICIRTEQATQPATSDRVYTEWPARCNWLTALLLEHVGAGGH